MASIQLSDVRAEYLRLVDALRTQAEASRAKVAAVLTTTTCEQLASHIIMLNGNVEEAWFDSYYLEKHELAKRKLVDRLKSALVESKIDLQILTETGELGRNDVVVIRNGRRLAVEGPNGDTLAIEIKASLGLDLSQIERYLLTGERLLLVRVLTQQVKLLDPNEHVEFLYESIKDVTAKAQRILDGKTILIPGVECNRCSLLQCPHNRVREVDGRRFIRMDQEEFDEDPDLFLKQLYPTIEKAVTVILSELALRKTMHPSLKAHVESSASSQTEPAQVPQHPPL